MFDFTKAQQEAISTLDKNVSVSAGAGSGKTRVLVERFINILMQSLYQEDRQITAADILAITFTRKAAGEMKERIRRRLAELEQEDALNAAFWRQQLAALEQARINTIHGFCNSLLKENPVEAGLDPAFQVAEEGEMDEFLLRTVQQFVKQGLRRNDSNIQRLADTYTASALVQQLLLVLPKLENILAAGDLSVPYVASAAVADDLQDTLQSLLYELDDGRESIKAAGHRKKLDLLSEHLPELLAAAAQSSEPENMALLDLYVGSLAATSSDKTTVKAAKEILQKLHLLAADKAALELVPCWQQVLADCAVYLREQQDLNNMLGFDDLESRALALLEHNQQVCRKNGSRYQYIMVDEFQDTNERQRHLVYLLCGGAKEQLLGHKLFVVGDAKQSIYRFRGADVSVFARVRRDIAATGGSNIVLDDNFRTVDKVLDLCNLAFAVLLGEDSRQDVYFEALNANRATDLLPEMLAVAYDKDSKSKRREAEAAVVAQRMLELHLKEQIPYEDMVLLLSALTTAKTFATALQQIGVPYTIVDGKGFYERQEIIDLLNLLIFLEDSSRSLELAGVLRAPYFAIDDESLTALFLKLEARKEEKLTLWQLLQEAALPGLIDHTRQQELRRTVVVLQKLRQCAAVMPLPELLHDIVERLQLEPLLAAQEFGMEKLANLKKLVALAEAFTIEKHGTLADYLLHLQQLRAAGAREAAAADMAGSAAVTIMTIHKSKGLEFPVVFVPALDARGKGDTDMLRFNEAVGLGIKVELGGELQDTSVMTQIKEIEKNLNAAEKQRQLYVAMTRAQDRLILSGTYDSGSKSKSETWFSSLRGILQDYDQLLLREYNATEVEATGCATAVIKKEQLPLELLERVKPLPEFGLGWQRSLSPTALQTYLNCQRSYYYKYILQMPAYENAAEAIAGGSDLPADLRGTVIHKALELLLNGYGAEEAFDAALQSTKVQVDTAKTKAMYLAYLSSELYKKRLGTEQKAEVSFSLPLLADYGIKAVFSGYIDCTVYNGDGTLTVIDYKTGQPPEAAEPRQGYIYQLALYKQAAALIWQLPVKEAELHFLQNNSCWQLPQDGEGTLQAASELCREIFTKREEVEFTVHTAYCRKCPFAYFCPQKNTNI